MTREEPDVLQPLAPSTRMAMLAALVVVIVHTAAVWGHPSLFWGDNGRWLHELDRVAHGATFYRDIYWAFPPLAMWVLGGITRVIGSDLVQVWTLTALLAVAIAATYGAVVARLVPGRMAVLVTVTGMTLGVVYSQQGSAPLALGMYSPAVPVAVLCLLLQLAAFLGDWSRPSLAGALLVGALGGLGFLAKHDVWFAAAWLTLAAGLFTATGRESRTTRCLAAGGAFVLIAGSGLAALAAEHGTGVLIDVLTGFGHVAEFSGVNLPDLSQLTVEAATFGLLLSAIAILARVGGLWRGRAVWGLAILGAVVAAVAMGIWLWQAERVASQMLSRGLPPLRTTFEEALRPIAADPIARLRRGFGVLRFQMLRHLIPVFMPLAALVALVSLRDRVRDPRHWRLVIIVLIACIALRARRMVSFTEWSVLMLEVPAYAAAAALLWPALRRPGVRTLQLTCALLLVVAARMQWRIGSGVGSRRGVLPAVETPRGAARLGPGLALDLNYLRTLADAVDPSHTRPIFAFGYSGGLSYFTGRPSVDPLTQGFRLSPLPTADSAYRLAAAMKPRLLLVDNRAFVDGVPSSRFAPWRWQPEMVLSPYQRVDRALFERLRAGCREVTRPGLRSAIFTMYDCARVATEAPSRAARSATSVRPPVRAAVPTRPSAATPGASHGA